MKKIFITGVMAALMAITGWAATMEYVDMGLSVKWATLNVGSTEFYNTGEEFSWGETQPKVYFQENSYQFGKMDNLTAYNAKDGKTKLDRIDDAASEATSGAGRMPTLNEIIELYKDCTWEETALNGNKLYKVTGPSGKFIYLPKKPAGGSQLMWSSERKTNDPTQAYGLEYYTSYGNQIIAAYMSNLRWKAGYVRPVQDVQDYGVSIGNTTISTFNRDNVTGPWLKSGKVTFDPTSNTLLLDNAVISSEFGVMKDSKQYFGIYVASSRPLSINVRGKNTITVATNEALAMKSSVEITQHRDGGTLAINQNLRDGDGGRQVGVQYLASGVTLTINQIPVEITGRNYAVRSAFANDTLRMRMGRGQLSKFKGSKGGTIVGLRHIDMDWASCKNYNAFIKPVGGKYDAHTKHVVDMYGHEVMEIHIGYTQFSLCGVGFGAATEPYEISKELTGHTAGTITYDGSSTTLTFNNVTLPANGTGYDAALMVHSITSSTTDSLWLNLKGVNRITSSQDGVCGIQLNQGLSIVGDGVLDVSTQADAIYADVKGFAVHNVGLKATSSNGVGLMCGTRRTGASYVSFYNDFHNAAIYSKGAEAAIKGQYYPVRLENIMPMLPSASWIGNAVSGSNVLMVAPKAADGKYNVRVFRLPPTTSPRPGRTTSREAALNAIATALNLSSAVGLSRQYADANLPKDVFPAAVMADETATLMKNLNAISGTIAFVLPQASTVSVEHVEAEPAEEATVVGIYSTDGRKLERMQQGINIVRMSDGTSRKVLK